MTGIRDFCFSLTYSNHGTGSGVERMSGAERGRERGGRGYLYGGSALIMNSAF